MQHEAICLRASERARARGGGHPRRHGAWRRPTAPPTPRRRVDGGDEAPQDRRPVATTPRARGRAVSRGFWTEPHGARPPQRPRRKRAQVLQLKSKIEQAMRTSVWSQISDTPRCRRDRVGSMARRFTKVRAILNSRRDLHTGHIPRLSRPRSSTSPSAARSWTTTRRRSRRSASRRTSRCARSPSR